MLRLSENRGASLDMSDVYAALTAAALCINAGVMPWRADIKFSDKTADGAPFG